MARITTGGGSGGLTEAEVEALIRANRITDLPTAVLDGLTLVGANNLSGNDQMKIHPSSNLLNLRITPAQYALIKPALAGRNNVKIVRTTGQVLLATKVVNYQEFDENLAQDDLVIELNDTGSMTGSEDFTVSLDFRGESADLWDDYVDERAEANFDKKVDSEKFAASDGFAFVGSGSDLQAGKVWVESGANADDLKMRARDASGADTLAAHIHAGTKLLFGDITAAYALVDVESVGAVTGSGANRVFSYKFAAHHAQDIVSGTDYPLRIYPDLPSALKDIIAPRSVPVWAMAPDGGSAGQVAGVKANGDVGFVTDRHTIKKSITRGETTTDNQANSTTYIQYPPDGTSTAATDSSRDLVVTPQTASDKVDVTWFAIAEYLPNQNTFTDASRRLDVKIERKIGSGSWTEVYQKNYACFGKGVIGNPAQLVVYTDSPNTTDECRYRISFKGIAVDANGNSGMRIGGQRFQIELTG